MLQPVAHCVARIAIAIVAVLVVAVSVEAQDKQDKQAEMKSALWCDTPDQVAGVMRAHHVDRLTLWDAAQRINTEANDPGACIFSLAMVLRTGSVRRLVAGKSIMVIDSYSVLGVMIQRRAVPGLGMLNPPQTWYSASVVGELEEL